MRKHAVTVMALAATILGFPAQAADFPQTPPQPNLPGIRFCPAPDCDNAEFLDTYYSVDAKTGEITAHTASGQNAVDNSHLDSGEVMVMAAPRVNPENRFVPPGHAFQSSNAYAAAPVVPPTQVVLPSASGPGSPADGGYVFDNNERVPWWKGGMWRNRRRDQQPPSSGNVAEARELDDTSSRGRAPQMLDDDDMWDDDEDFDGYGDDGSFDSSYSRSGGGSSGGRGGYDDFDDDDPYGTPSFGGGGGDDEFGMMSPPRGGPAGNSRTPVGGGAAGGRDTYANNGGNERSGPLPIPPGGGYGGDDDFDDPFPVGGMSGGGMSGGMSGGMPGGGYSEQPYSASATVYSDPSGGSYGDAYSSGGYSSGTYSAPYSGSLDSAYLDTSVYGQTGTVNDSFVQSSPANEGTASFLDGSPYASMNYTPPTIESLTGGYSGGSYDMPGYGASGSYDSGYMSSGPSSYDSYSSGPAMSGPPMMGPPPGPASDPFGAVPGPPSYQSAPSVDAQGSPQFENAVRLVKENRFSEAKNILASETNRNPSNASAWRWLADCYYNLLELDDAINAYQRALERDPNDYYALRGQGFSYLHRGHEYWRRMQEEVARGEKDAAATTFAHAHDNYKKSLELLGLCLRRAPNDGEAIYGEAMAAEGASRKLYSNAISYLKLGPEHRERAELFAENCLTVINKGIERAKERAKQNPGDAGPRALLGGLYLRKAILYNQLGKTDMALAELRNSRDVQQSILDEIDKNNATARKNIREAEIYWDRWGGNRR